MSDSEARRRWITLGELIALLALVVSAVGVWISWKNNGEDKPTRVVEQHQSVPLSLRAVADRDGSELTISPVEPSHGLQSLTVSIKGASPIEVGSDGRLQASDIQAALRDRPKEAKDVTHSMRFSSIAATSTACPWGASPWGKATNKGSLNKGAESISPHA